MHCNDHNNENKNYSRRDFLTKTSLGLGALSLGSLISPVNSYGQSNFLNLLDKDGLLFFTKENKSKVSIIKCSKTKNLERLNVNDFFLEDNKIV